MRRPLLTTALRLPTHAPRLLLTAAPRLLLTAALRLIGGCVLLIIAAMLLGRGLPRGVELIFQARMDTRGNTNLFVLDIGRGLMVPMIEVNTNLPENEPAWSPDGERLLFTSVRDGDFDIYVLEADGVIQQLTYNTVNDLRPQWSPDGTRIAFASPDVDGVLQIFVMEDDGSNLHILTFDGGYDPDWSPDGTRIVYTCVGSLVPQICIMNADGSGRIGLTEGRNPNSRPAWSPDGTRIAFVSTNGFGTGIALIDVDGRNYRPLNAPTQINETPRWSPDGTQIVFESGREIYIMNPDGSALRRLTRTLQPETMPTWRP